MKKLMILAFTVILNLPFITGVTPATAQTNSDNQWTNCAPFVSCEPMPTARVHLRSGVINERIFAIGGCCLSGGTRLNNFEEYNPSNNTWTIKPAMPSRRLGPAVGVVDGKIYVIGGEPNGPPVNTVEAYDPITETWTTKAPMPTARALPSGLST